MSKRDFRRELNPQKAQAQYPDLASVRRDRRAFLKGLGLGLLGAGTLASLAACGDRALGDKKKPEPDAWELGGARPEPDAGPPDLTIETPDSGTAPMPDLSGAALPPDAGVVESDSWETAGGPDQPPDAGVPSGDR